MGAEKPELWIEIRNWERFQHYGTRRPPWIKIYLDLQHDHNWLQLTLRRRGILVGLWLEYASARRALPGDTLSVTRALRERVVSADLKALSDAGFIRIVASKLLAPRARTRETETEKEKELTTSSETYAVARAHARNADGENPINDEEAEPEMPDAPWLTPAELPADLWRMP